MFFLQIYLSVGMYVALRQWTRVSQILKDRNDIKMRRTSRISKKRRNKKQKQHLRHLLSKCKGGNPLISMFSSNCSWTILSMLPTTIQYN